MSSLFVEETPTWLRLRAERSVLQKLRSEFMYQPPNYWRTPSYQLYKATLHTPNPKGWDGWLSLVEWAQGGTAILMRGHKDTLLQVCKELEIEVTGTWLNSVFSGLTVDDIPDDIIAADFSLDHGQRTCIASLLNRSNGVIKASISSGKTAIFAATAGMIKRRLPTARVLYIVPNERLVNQVTVEMRKFLPALDVSQAGGSKRNFDGKDMVVATMPMLARNMKELLPFFKSFTAVFVDECHHVTAETWSTVLRLIPALFRYGASDTIKADRKEDICKFYQIRGLLGPERSAIDTSPLIKTGRVAKPHLHLIDMQDWEGRYDDVPHVPKIGTPAWALVQGEWLKGIYRGGAVDETAVDAAGNALPTEIKGKHTIEFADRGTMDVESRWCLLQRAFDVAIIRNKERNKLIVDWASHFSKKGWPTLVVATRWLHILILEDMLKKAGRDVRILTGSGTSKERNEVFKWLTDDPESGHILISPLVKEGVSLPALRGGVVADVVASTDLARQIIGRFIRKKPTGDNEGHVAWFIDRQYTSARRNCLRLFAELERVKGFSYFWPCAGPEVEAPKYAHANFD